MILCSIQEELSHSGGTAVEVYTTDCHIAVHTSVTSDSIVTALYLTVVWKQWPR